jgi:hypothetical protein
LREDSKTVDDIDTQIATPAADYLVMYLSGAGGPEAEAALATQGYLSTFCSYSLQVFVGSFSLDSHTRLLNFPTDE